MPASPPLPPKKEVALALLERSSDRGIYVHLDPRRPGVVVPPWFKKQPQLVLQIGLNMAIPIPDLRLDDEGLTCTLSFNRAPFFCAVPWSGVFAIVDDDAKGMVWPEDVPAEIARQTQVRAVETPRKEPWKSEGNGAKGSKSKRPRKRPPLAAVPGEEPPKAEAAVDHPPEEPSALPAPAPASQPTGRSGKPRRELPPYLRIVK